MNKTQEDLQQRSHHAPPRAATNSQTFREVFRSNLHKSEKIFTKQVPPLDSSAHDLQNPKISSPETAASASMRRHKLTTTRGLILQICANLSIILEI